MRRGQAEFFEWFPRLALLLIAFVVVVALVKYFTAREIDDSQIATTALLERAYAEISWQENGRIYTGIVDPSRLESFGPDYTEGQFSEAAIKLVTQGVSCYPGQTIYSDKLTFDRYYAFAKGKILGPQSAALLEQAYPIVVRTPQGDCPTTLNITIVRPNS